MIENKINNILNKTNSNLNIVEDLDNKNILIYGAGNIGKNLYKTIQNKNINILGFIDKNDKLPNEILGLKVFLPENTELNELKESAHIIIAGIFDVYKLKEIKSCLSKLGYKNVHSIYELDLNKYTNLEFRKLLNRRDDDIIIAKRDKEKIISAYNLLENNEDKAFYIDYIEACLTMDFTKISNPLPRDLQYLAHDINVEKNYSYFVDCGAYDGDTIQNLIDKNNSVKNIIAFEPQNKLFEELQLRINKIKEIESAILLPCGVSNESTVYRFKHHEVLTSSCIDDEGDDIIQCLSIDESFIGFEPTFIKMDIEGHEINALKGSKRTIKKYKPQLAISVYHSLSDLWNIILLINEINPSYKFYLRNYSYLGFETVLYAF